MGENAICGLPRGTGELEKTKLALGSLDSIDSNYYVIST
jgi:hypothetical protein